MSQDDVIYDTLVFEGGGVLGAGYLGALDEAEREGLVRIDLTANGHAYRFAGASIGAAIASLLACGASVASLRATLGEWDASTTRDSFTENNLRRTRRTGGCCAAFRYLFVPFTVLRDLYRLYKRGGIWRGEVLRNIFAAEVKKLTSNAEITLGEVHERFGTELIVSAYCIDDEELVYFSRRTHPDMPLVTAVLASMAVLGLFEWVEYDGKRYCDPGFVENLPIHVYDDVSEEDCHRRRCHPGTLAFKLLTDEEIHRVPSEEPVRNVFDAVPRLLRSIMSTVQRVHQHTCDFDRTVRINMHDLEAFDFDLTDEKKSASEEYGRAGVQEFIERRNQLTKRTLTGPVVV